MFQVYDIFAVGLFRIVFVVWTQNQKVTAKGF